jgi:hypothetical protein
MAYVIISSDGDISLPRSLSVLNMENVIRMAKRFKIHQLEREKPNLEALVVHLVNKGGQAEAARVLDVTQATISNYLKRLGYRPVTIYLKEGE